MSGNKPRVLITGSEGFIGSNLCDFLLEKKYPLTLFDNKNEKFQTLTSYDNLLHSAEGSEIIVHLGARASVSDGETEPYGTIETNVLGTLNVLRVAQELKIKAVIAGSIASAGDIPSPIYEDDILTPKSIYAISKKCCQELTEFYADQGAKVLMLRFSSVYGIGRASRQTIVVNSFVKKAIERKPITIYGDGKQIRDFTHIDDVCRAIQMAILNKFKWGEVYNISLGQPTSIIDLVARISHLLDKPIQLKFKPEQTQLNRVAFFDISKAKKCGYQPRIRLDEGIKRMVEYYGGK